MRYVHNAGSTLDRKTKVRSVETASESRPNARRQQNARPIYFVEKTANVEQKLFGFVRGPVILDFA